MSTSRNSVAVYHALKRSIERQIFHSIPVFKFSIVRYVLCVSYHRAFLRGIVSIVSDSSYMAFMRFRWRSVWAHHDF
jgi:hypothetical protein